jgi:hypothetical protein
MYQTEQVSASEVKDLEARLVHRLDQMDAKWQHQLRMLEIRLDSEKSVRDIEKRFLDDLLMMFVLWAPAALVLGVLLVRR